MLTLFVLIQRTRKSDLKLAISTRTCLERNCKASGEMSREKNSGCLLWTCIERRVREKRTTWREYTSAKSTGEDNGMSSERSFLMLASIVYRRRAGREYYLHAPIPTPLDFWIGTHLCHQLCERVIRAKPGSRLSRSVVQTLYSVRNQEAISVKM